MAIWVRVNWDVASAPIPDTAHGHLSEYLVRYAQTYAVAVREVGTGPEGVELVLILPFDKSLESVIGPLQEASAKFLRSALGAKGFAWKPSWRAISLAPLEATDEDPDVLPGWLRPVRDG